MHLAGRRFHAAAWKAQFALLPLDRAIRSLELVLAKEPQQADARRCLCYAHAYRAQAMEKLTQPADAVRDWDRAIELGNGFQKTTSFQLARAGRGPRDGQARCCAAQAEAMAASSTERAEDLFDAACYCTRASDITTKDRKRANQYADRAMALLQRAVEKGYRGVDHVKTDPALDVLRTREDFRKLLLDLANKVKSEK